MITQSILNRRSHSEGIEAMTPSNVDAIAISPPGETVLFQFSNAYLQFGRSLVFYRSNGRSSDCAFEVSRES